jgi:hypothetical protein
MVPRCVFVIGMHRSGTSATAEVLGQMGLGLPSVDELVPATRTNERGHFESKTLVRLNERLLAALGGTWSAPPLLAPGWERSATLDDLRGEAADSFALAFPRPPAAWKDPRNCIVLPFWRTVLGPDSAAVFVHRHPLEVARSLQSRDGIRLTQGLALWERYIRAACANLDGLPTLCTDYQRVLDDPGAWCGEVVAFLESTGVTVDPALQDALPASIDAGLRHQGDAVDADAVSGWDRSQEATLSILRALDGPHHPWRSPDLGSEPDWVGDVLSMGLEVDTLGRDLRLMTRTHAYRWASAVTRLGSRRP